MAELGNLSIVVDLSGLTRATAAVNSFSALVAKMANEVEQLRGKKGPSDLSLTINAMAQSVRKANADLVNMMNTLNRNAGKGLDANAKAADAMAQSVRKANADLVIMMNTLNRNAGKGLDANAKAAEVLATKIGKAEAATHRMNKAMDEKKSSAKPAAGGGGWLDGLMDVKNRAGVAVSAQGGLNPFAASMVTMPPQLAAVAVAAGVALGGITALAEGVFSLGASALETGMKFQRLAATLAVVGGGKAGAAREFEYVAEMANKFGIGLEAATNSYSKFALASQAAGLSQRQTRSIFEATSKAIVATGVSSDAGARAFLALEQALSKGTLQAEEVKKQFAGNLPSGFAMFAEAAYRAGKTADNSIGTFMKAMKTGTLESKAIILELASVMEDRFGTAFAGASNNLERNIARMNNSWDLLLKTIADSGLIDAASEVVGGLAKKIQELAEYVKNFVDSDDGETVKDLFHEMAITIKLAVSEFDVFIRTMTQGENGLVSIAKAMKWVIDEIVGFIEHIKALAGIFGALATTFVLPMLWNDRWREFCKQGIMNTLGFDTALQKLARTAQQTKDIFENWVDPEDVKGIGDRAPIIHKSTGGVQMYQTAPVIKETAPETAVEQVKKLTAAEEKRLTLLREIAAESGKYEKELNVSIEARLNKAGITNRYERELLKGKLEGLAAIKEEIKAAKLLVDYQKDRLAALKEIGNVETILAKQSKSEKGKEAYTLSPDLQQGADAWVLAMQKAGVETGKTRVETAMLGSALEEAARKGIITWQQFYEVVKGIKKESKSLAETIGEGFVGLAKSMSDSFVGMAIEGKSSFSSLVVEMLKGLAKLIFYYGVLVPLMKSMGGNAGGGFWGTMGNAIAAGAGGKATGGSVTAGSSYLVGERGPEMFVPGRSGAIANNSQLTGGSSTPPINISIVVTPTTTTTEKKSGDDERGNASKLARQLGDAVRGVIMEELRPGGLIRESAR